MKKKKKEKQSLIISLIKAKKVSKRQSSSFAGRSLEYFDKSDFFMENEFAQKLEDSKDFPEIFEVVKEGVEKVTGKSRAGLMLGLADLGGSPGSFLGAYYPISSNIIVMNTFPLKSIRESREELLKPYIFTVLMHEYVHSLGWHDEDLTRKITYDVCQILLGNEHLATQLAKDITKFMPHFSYANYGYFPTQHPQIRLVEGFDRGNVTYVS